MKVRGILAVCTLLLSAAVMTADTPRNRDNRPALKLLAPNGGETLEKGTETLVKWESRNIPGGDLILVLYYKGVKIGVISRGAPDTGQFLWTIPRDIPADDYYRVRIRWSRNPALNDFSDADFRIREQSK